MRTLKVLLESYVFTAVVFLVAGVSFAQTPSPSAAPPAAATELRTPEEKHLRNVRQLTFGGSNAEAYFSADGKKLIFQSTRNGLGCDQIFTMNLDGSDQKMVSTGKGRTTCSYIFPSNEDGRLGSEATHDHARI
jgi:dipeptidyl aminopeptidase/acylaminoacyl peptidase